MPPGTTPRSAIFTEVHYPHLAFSPEGRHLAVGNLNGTVYIFRLAGPPAEAKAP
jgi:hypothetical protein